MGMYVPWLADAARMTGYPVVEVPGWRGLGHGGMRVAEGVVGHHTANPQRGDYPSLNIVRNGRGDLAGPLAQFGLARSGTVFVIAAGLAYHAGASSWTGFNDLNDEFLGIEAESSGTRDDWTPEQRDCYPRLVAALLHFMRRGADRFGFHKEVCRPRGRKIDAAFWDPPGMRGRVQWLLQDPIHRIPRGGGGGGGEPPPSIRKRKVIDVVENHIVRGNGTLKLICPVGKASGVVARAFLSAALADGQGTIRVFAQDDDSGVNDWTWTLGIRDGRSDRPYRELADGTTQLVIQHNLTGSGTLCLETIPK